MTQATRLAHSWIFTITHTYISTWVCLCAKEHQKSPEANIKRLKRSQWRISYCTDGFEVFIHHSHTLSPHHLHWGARKSERTPSCTALAELSIIKYGDRGQRGWGVDGRPCFRHYSNINTSFSSLIHQESIFQHIKFNFKKEWADTVKCTRPKSIVGFPSCPFQPLSIPSGASRHPLPG